jgi:Ca-activated chloride channel family protein
MKRYASHAMKIRRDRSKLERRASGLRLVLWSAVLVLFLASEFVSQEGFNPQRIRVQSALVTVPVIVSDSQGRFLPGLGIDSFKLFQDGLPVPMSLFLTSEDPIKIALLLDTSLSATTILDKIKKAAGRFLKQMRPQDLAMVMSFDSDIEVLCPLSSDQRELKDAVKNAKGGGENTRMRDAIHEIAQHRFRSITGRKAIVILTDGQDHGSRISATELLDAVAASSTLIYSIFYNVDPRELVKKLVGVASRIPKTAAGGQPKTDAEWNEREEQAAQYLENISELSAGRFYRSRVTEFDAAFKQISEELRSQYLLGFYPDQSKLDGAMHALVVSVAEPGALVRNRRSYRAVP